MPKIGWKCRYPIRVLAGDKQQEVACSRCLPCRIRREQSWVLRMRLEQSSASYSAFLTLTYSEVHRPYSLPYNHIADYLRRLRKQHPLETVRFTCAGEFGEKTEREHWHLCIFSSINLFPSLGILHDPTWQFGAMHIGTLTTKSARYVASYSLKSQGRNDTTWQVSRRPGIGVNEIRHLALCSAALRKNSPLPTALRLGSSLYPLDRTMRAHYQNSFEENGGTIIPSENSNSIYVDRPETLLRAIQNRRQDDKKQLDIFIERKLTEIKYETF